jgi:hypothetical protein
MFAIAGGEEKASPKAKTDATMPDRNFARPFISISSARPFADEYYPILMICVIIFRYSPVNESEESS